MEVTVVTIFRGELVTSNKYTINDEGELNYKNFLQVARIDFDPEHHDLYFGVSDECDLTDLMFAQPEAAAGNGEVLVVTEKNLFTCKKS